MRKYLLLLFIITLFNPFCSSAYQDLPKRPEPPRLVNDFAGMLSISQEAELERKLVNYSDSTSTQIAVVTIETLDGNEIADYTNRLGESWGIGEKGKDNGIVILIAKKEREVRLEVGYGLEGVIPDMVAKRIQDEVMIPEFKKGNFYEGINKATDVIIHKAFGEFKGDGKKKKEGRPVWIVLIIIMVILFIISKLKGPGNGGNISRRGYSGAGGFMGMGGGLGGGAFGGGFGGGGSGGFGGFGGGGFGGGGASGKW